MTDRRTFLCEDFEISYEDTKKGWSMPYSHHHTNYEIYILLSGERLVTIGDITYRVEAGMASLFESNISHRSVGDTDYTGICIHFSKTYLQKYFLPAVVSSYLTCFKAPIIFIPEDYRQKLVDWNAASCCKSPTAYLLLAQILTDLAAFRYQYPLEMKFLSVRIKLPVFSGSLIILTQTIQRFRPSGISPNPAVCPKAMSTGLSGGQNPSP